MTAQPADDGSDGRGIVIQTDPDTLARSTVTVARSVVENNHQDGIGARGSTVVVDAVTVRSILPEVSSDNFGRESRTTVR